MILMCKWARNLKEAVVAYFKFLSQYLFQEAGESHGNFNTSGITIE